MSDYVEYLKEVFEPFAAVQAKRMFGGHGVFHNGLMIGLVADDTLYLKADSDSAQQFETLGLARFVYEKRGKPMAMSYYQAPAEMFEDPAHARKWAERAYEAAVRADRRKHRPARDR